MDRDSLALLKGEKVTKDFGGLRAVAGVDFHVQRGEILGLIGPNGAGKTTLFSLIAGSTPVTSGMVRFKGESISGLKPYQICRMGIVRTFQAGNLFARMTVHENVFLGAVYGTRKSAQNTADLHDEVMDSLDLVGLSDKKDVLAKDLPVGAQKRLEVARALATKPELLLLDEVMAGLTHTEVAESLDLIKKIRNRGITVFMIEHVMKAIMGISDRVIVLHHGEKIAEGTPQEVAASPLVIKVYLGE
jgi:branched-chain amino acid transport system ATP-binding protein